MRTALLICAENAGTISDLFVAALQEQHAADRVVGIGFADLERVAAECFDVDHVVVFPCVIGLSNALREDLTARMARLQAAHPEMRVHLANPLGNDPRLIEMVRDRLTAALKGAQNAPILTVAGPAGVRLFMFDDFRGLPDQIPDVRTVAPDRRGQGVWVRAVLDDTPDAQAVFFADDDRFSSAVDLALVRDRGLLIYALDGEPLPPSLGGPLRLLIPDYDDRCANVKGVAQIEIRKAE